MIDFLSKYAWFVSLKEKRGVTSFNVFQSTLNKLKRKLNKICVDQGSEFYENSFKKWLKDNEIDVYST